MQEYGIPLSRYAVFLKTVLKSTSLNARHFLFRSKSCKKLIKSLEEKICVLGMSYKSDGREKVKREDTHDGLSINYISALNKINVIIRKDNHVYELSDVLYASKFDFNFFRYFSSQSILFTGLLYQRKNEKSTELCHIYFLMRIF